MDLNTLKDILPEDQICTNGEKLNEYARDWTKFYTPKASAILFPKTTDEVQKIVKWANNQNVSLVPSGGRTGLSAGAFATNQEIVVSFEKMNKIYSLDSVGKIIHCQAGVVTETLQDYASKHNLYFPIDFAAKGSSHIGGNIATNAGGIKVLRYGLTRDWVAGLTVVTGKGDVLNLNHALIKNATGYDFRHLFIGSEGTLGFITEVEIKLTTPPKDFSVLVLAIDSLEKIMQVFQKFSTRSVLNAFEFFTDQALEKVLNATNQDFPLNERQPYYVLIEVENASESEHTNIISIFEDCFEHDLLADGIINQSSKQAQELWSLRENISESIAPFSPYKNDISVRLSSIPKFLDDLKKLTAIHYPNFEVIIFGHIGDGNLHLNILKPDFLSPDEFVEHCKKTNEILFSMIQQHKGSISAEHGVGLVKKQGLKFSRSDKEIELMKSIKKIFDPNSIINPNKIFD